MPYLLRLLCFLVLQFRRGRSLQEDVGSFLGPELWAMSLKPYPCHGWEDTLDMTGWRASLDGFMTWMDTYRRRGEEEEDIGLGKNILRDFQEMPDVYVLCNESIADWGRFLLYPAPLLNIYTPIYYGSFMRLTQDRETCTWYISVLVGAQCSWRIRDNLEIRTIFHRREICIAYPIYIYSSPDRASWKLL